MSDPEGFKLVETWSPSGGSDALQRAIFDRKTPSIELLKQATAGHGAMDGFTVQVIEDHMMQAEGKREAARVAEELIGIVHSDLK